MTFSVASVENFNLIPRGASYPYSIAMPQPCPFLICSFMFSNKKLALDCTATLPLVNSLNHFAYLASTSPRIREMVMLDGGLERLIHILRRPPQNVSGMMMFDRASSSSNEIQANWKWSLAFQCVVNIGVRGSEAIRTRVVEAGMVPIIIRVLDNYLMTSDLIHIQQRKALAAVREWPASRQESHHSLYPPQPATVSTVPRPATPMDMDTIHPPAEHTYWTVDADRQASRELLPLHNRIAGDASASASASECAEDTEMFHEEGASPSASELLAPKNDAPESETPRAPRTSTLRAEADSHIDMAHTPRARAHNATMPDAMQQDEDVHLWQTPTPVSNPREVAPVPPPVYREEEVLLSLQLLAYLSKYPHVRHFFHNADVREDMIFCPEWPEETLPNRSWQPSDLPQSNVFSVAERFTHRPTRSSTTPNVLCSLYPRLAPDIQYWAGVVMRNACRKDESRGGIRQCANMLCGKWEAYPREFAKCRRCRKAKYCSKQCQSKGWQMGHRFWCSARSDDDKTRGTHESRSNVHTSVAPDVSPNNDGHAAGTTQLPRDPTNVRSERDTVYSRPLGPRHVPSTFRENQMPSLRGVSAASADSTDLTELSDDGTRQGETSSTTSPAGTNHASTAAAQRTLPAPVIAGDLTIQEADPATATLQAQEAQNIQEHGPLDIVAATWPPPPPSVVSSTSAADMTPSLQSQSQPQSQSVQPSVRSTTETHFDLGITLPSSGQLTTSHIHDGDHSVSTRSPYTSPWQNMATPTAFRSAHHAPRAMSMFSTVSSSPVAIGDGTVHEDPPAITPTSQWLPSWHAHDTEPSRLSDPQ